MEEHLVRWEAIDLGPGRKDPSWYWAVGIIAAGVAVAAVIIGNYLLAVIAVVGGFAIMLAGSIPSIRQKYALSERGIYIGSIQIPYENVKKFRIIETEPRVLMLETASIVGTASLPLGDADWRTIRMELKNRNIDEDDELDSFSEKIARAIGI